MPGTSNLYESVDEVLTFSVCVSMFWKMKSVYLVCFIFQFTSSKVFRPKKNYIAGRFDLGKMKSVFLFQFCLASKASKKRLHCDYNVFGKRNLCFVFFGSLSASKIFEGLD